MRRRTNGTLTLPGGARVRRRRIGRHPVVATAAVLLAAAAVGWLWYSVFSPLFDEPRDWVSRQRDFRRAIAEVLTGADRDAPPAPPLPVWPPVMDDDQRELVACAEGQVARGVRLSTRYHPMAYPWGDLPGHLGSSPDLIIRCLRAIGLDLQQLVHVDRVRHARRYPLHLWASSRADKAIDHRRLANLYTFLAAFTERGAITVDSPEKLAAFVPGDLVFWTTASGGEYPGLAGIVLDRRDEHGVPLVATLAPDDRRTTDHHRLTDWPLTGHLRVRPEAILERFFEDNPQARLVAHPPSD
jgi:uncharacterized protein